MNNKKELLNAMNEINAHLHRTKKKKWINECNVMGCRNKPIYKFSANNGEYFIYSCKKHKEDFSPNSFGGIFKEVKE